ncbi:MAG: SDR family oxidoreductase [Chloroflexi bacterium]|nr:SDR family oxidoreductase [Chloroflexota bacterium]
MMDTQQLFSVAGQTVVITGGSGVLGSGMALALGAAGARIAVLGRHPEKAAAVAGAIRENGGEALGLACDVMEKAALEEVAGKIQQAFGPIDILINGVGGNQPQASTGAGHSTPSFFELDPAAVGAVADLNFLGTFMSCQVFGRSMAERKRGCILNIASLSAERPLTRVAGYSAAKAAVVNFTRWLAVHMAQEYSPEIRVNALSPGFFLTEQNRYLLTDAQTGGLTARGQAILSHTPMARFGVPEDLLGAVFWLVSPASRFVTGTVVTVDGGFTAYAGV